MSSHWRCRGVSSPVALPASHAANWASSSAERCCSSCFATCRATSLRERGRRLGGSAANSWNSAVKRPSSSAACCISVSGSGHTRPAKSSRVSPGRSSTTRSQASAASSSGERRSASMSHAGRVPSATSMPVSQMSCCWEIRKCLPSDPVAQRRLSAPTRTRPRRWRPLLRRRAM